MSELPKWPDDLDSKIRDDYTLLFEGMIACDAVMNHERALRLAWEARARLLLEALQKRAHHLVNDGDCWYSCPASGKCCNENRPKTECDCGADEAEKAIALIGPLPPEQG